MIRKWRFLFLVLAAVLTIATPSWADDFRPAYLQLIQANSTTYDVLWKVPALNEDATLRVRPEFPQGTVKLTRLHSSYANGTAVQRWRVQTPGGLEGKSIVFPGLSEVRIDVLARLARADGTVQLERISPDRPEFRVEAAPAALEVVQTYTLLGIEHILAGFDHLTFVLALVLIVGLNRRLVWTITAFTVAHSITLALATIGVIHVPGPPVEAAIALSIVFVASEIIQKQRGRQSLAANKPWLVAFAFGLLHGLGFAGALAEIGLPANSIPIALLFFNIGVEIGQLMFVGAIVAILAAATRLASKQLQLRAWKSATAYVIGGIASYWVIERLFTFWA